MATKPVKNAAVKAAPAKPVAAKPQAVEAAKKTPAKKPAPAQKTPAKKKITVHPKLVAPKAPPVQEQEVEEVEVEATGTLGLHELAEALRVKVHETGAALPTKLAETVVKGFEEVIEEAVAQGREINLPGFGKFSTTLRPARTGRNPRTGETVEIPASFKVAFKPGRLLKDAANSRPAV